MRLARGVDRSGGSSGSDNPLCRERLPRRVPTVVMSGPACYCHSPDDQVLGEPHDQDQFVSPHLLVHKAQPFRGFIGASWGTLRPFPLARLKQVPPFLILVRAAVLMDNFPPDQSPYPRKTPSVTWRED